MSHVTEVIDQIEKLDPVDREQVLCQLSTKFPPSSSSDFYPNIVKTAGVCGGDARIIRTRIPVWLLERMRQFNVSESEILRSYPTLRAIDLVQAWAYTDNHRGEIEAQIRENEED